MAVASKRARLARAVALGLMASYATPHAFAQQIVVSDGSTQVVSGTTYDTGTTANDPGVTILAENAGSRIEGTDVTATTGGINAHGVLARSGGAVQLRNGSITTRGVGASAVRLETDASVTLQAVDLVSERGAGVVVGERSQATIDGGSVTAFGNAVFADRGRITSTGATLTGNGSSAVVQASNGGRVELSGGTVAHTTGLGIGLLATGLGSTINAGNGVVVTTRGGAAARVDGGATMAIDGASLGATEGGTALHVAGAQSNATVANATLASTGGTGVYLYDGGSATLTDTNVSGTRGVLLQAAEQANGGTLTLSGGRVQSTESTIVVDSGTHALTLSNGAQLESGQGTLIDVGGQGTLAATFDGVQLAGDLVAVGASAFLDVAFRNGASLTGGMSGVNDVDLSRNTTWTVTHTSDTRNLLHAGTIAFSELPAGTTDPAAFRTLTVHDDHSGHGGTLVLNTVLEDDDLLTDLLHVSGNTSGNTTLRIHAVGGAGVATEHNGIRVVQVDGQSNGTFTLDGRVVAGAFDYNLFQGGVVETGDGDWYLRSAPNAPPPPGDPGPQPPTGPEFGDGMYRPEVGAWLMNQAMTMSAFRSTRGDRLVDAGVDEDLEPRSVWVRAQQHHVDTRIAKDQLTSGTDTHLFEIGADIARWKLDPVFLSVGAIYSESDSETTERSLLSGYSATGELAGRSFTLYGTWSTTPSGRTGWYLDQWVQDARFRHRVQGQGLVAETYKTKRRSASAEGGYGFVLHQSEGLDFVLTPQVQVVYADFVVPTHTEANGTVLYPKAPHGWTARAGLRLSSNIGGVLRPYIEASAWDDQRTTTITFNQTPVVIAAPGRVHEYTAGLSAGSLDGWSAWANFGVQHGQDLRAAQGQVGVRFRW